MASSASIRAFWDEHVCGDVFTSLTDRQSQRFFKAAREGRYRYCYHLMPFLMRAASCPGPMLEIGCGIGVDLEQLRRVQPDAIGIDLTPNAVELARRHVGGDVRVGDAERLDFPDHSFGVVYSWGVLHHTADIARAIREVHRVLRPGGRAFLMLYARWSLNHLVHATLSIPYESPRDWSVDAPVTRTFSKRGVRRLLSDFVDVRIEKHYLFGAGYRPLVDYVPQAVNKALGRLVGWHLLIDARRP